jgi:hypothetical protein
VQAPRFAAVLSEAMDSPRRGAGDWPARRA